MTTANILKYYPSNIFSTLFFDFLEDGIINCI